MHRLWLISVLVTFSLLFTSIVYACSGHDFMPMSSMSADMDNKAMERGPCDKRKQDICKSVRYQMLSVQASSPVPELLCHVLTPISACFEIPLAMDLLPTTGPPGVVVHPVSNLSFSSSSQILRI
jgi:hypothetical protein